MFLDEINNVAETSAQFKADNGNYQVFLYESIMQDLEARIRGHIRVQKQLELHIETIENKLEETQADNTILREANDGILELQEELEKKKQIEIQNHEFLTMQNHLQQTIDEISKYRDEQEQITKTLTEEFKREIQRRDQDITELKSLIEKQNKRILQLTQVQELSRRDNASISSNNSIQLNQQDAIYKKRANSVEESTAHDPVITMSGQKQIRNFNATKASVMSHKGVAIPG